MPTSLIVRTAGLKTTTDVLSHLLRLSQNDKIATGVGHAQKLEPCVPSMRMQNGAAVVETAWRLLCLLWVNIAAILTSIKTFWFDLAVPFLKLLDNYSPLWAPWLFSVHLWKIYLIWSTWTCTGTFAELADL